MAKFSRLTVLNNMVDTGMIPVFYHPDADVAEQIVRACLDGGLRCVEFTNRGDMAHIVYGELAQRFKEDERLILGVGSVVDAPTAAQYLQLGANFIVGPVLNAEVARVCNRRKVAYSPGCGTTSEISQAEELGVEIVKIFPGSLVGGPAFVKAIAGPMPWTRIMPTGGVSPDEDNLRAWFAAGVACVGMGSKLITKELVAAGDFDAIRQKTAETVALIQKLKTEFGSKQ